ncbi:MAG: nonstructural protein [Microviridae sp.]|nr:MAG: nonstructural protein [Microviridae sp.]
MQKRFYSLYDEKADVYSNPFTAQNGAVALRSLATAASDPSTEVSKYPHDFTLYELGVFDDSTGTITPHQNPTNLGKASQFSSAEV